MEGDNKQGKSCVADDNRKQVNGEANEKTWDGTEGASCRAKKEGCAEDDIGEDCKGGANKRTSDGTREEPQKQKER